MQKAMLEQQIAGLTQQAEGERNSQTAAADVASSTAHDAAAAEAIRIDDLVREINERLLEIAHRQPEA